MKKFLLMLLSIITITTSSLFLVACDKEKETAKEDKVMNIKLNPEVEFILNDNNKVVSVNALNEEGNIIIEGTSFVGKSAEEAAELFVSISKENGYLVSGSSKTEGNNIEISLSGDADASKKIFDSVKSTVSSYLTKENITATLTQASAITKVKLKELVEQCSPYLDEAKISSMSYKELINELVASRKETAEMYSQELKDAYYEAKENAYNLAQLNYIKENGGAMASMAINFVMLQYTSAINSLESLRKTQLLDENSAYQKALKSLYEKKAEFLNYRNEVSQMEESEITPVIEATLNQYQTALTNAETALSNAKQAAEDLLNSSKLALNLAYNAVVTALSNINIQISQYADSMSSSLTTSLETFTTNFETNYASLIEQAKSKVEDMKDDLNQTQQN